MPSTSMSLRSFLSPSSTSACVRNLVESLGWLRILLKDCALDDAAAPAEVVLVAMISKGFRGVLDVRRHPLCI